ncbi:MAG: CoA-binding protein [Cyclobacteriaceae bacterium]|nr:CoA-binding protein [Cyclobacteriaceae bacterium]
MKTVVLGATTNPARYAFAAAERLHHAGLDFELVGIKKGELFGKDIQDLRDHPEIADVHTVTLYLGPVNQKQWYNYILMLNPRRVIFNPGTENPELAGMLQEQGIGYEYACTLTLLSVGNYFTQ